MPEPAGGYFGDHWMQNRQFRKLSQRLPVGREHFVSVNAVQQAGQDDYHAVPAGSSDVTSAPGSKYNADFRCEWLELPGCPVTMGDCRRPGQPILAEHADA